MRSRDEYIDFLKFVGLTMIMLAHVHPPVWLYELRSFDVPLMLFASGLAFSGKQIDSQIHFLCTRTLRLVTPVYLFLIGYFIALWFLPDRHVQADEVVGSFLLLNAHSIGYVWVIKVFLLVMLCTPVMLRLDRKLNDRQWNAAILVLLVAVELSGLLLAHLKPGGLAVYYAYYETVQFVLAYSIPFLFGLRFRVVERRRKQTALFLLALLMAVVLLVLYAQTGDALHLSTRYKFPPRAAFILWGTLAAFILWSARRMLGILSRLRLIAFCGRHTLWIYLWHIPLVSLTRPLGDHWLPRLVLVWCVSLALYAVQISLVKWVERRHPHPLLRYLRD